MTEQQRRNLAHGNPLRQRRADWKRRIKAGETTVAKALYSEDPALATLEVGKLLEWQRGVGPLKVEKLLARHGIRWSKQVGELTRRQRGLLA